VIKKICICGHSITTHNPAFWQGKAWDDSEYNQEACYQWITRDFTMCPCDKFRLNNLKYLEQLYEAKNGKLKTV
jgi:hypothetical protein